MSRSKKHYAGIGSRETPPEIGLLFKRLAYSLQKAGFILRSGGADGADTFFESGVTDEDDKEIFIPSKGFNNNPSNLYTQSPESFEMAAKFHPNWSNLSDYVKKIHARNCYQIMGRDLNTPVKFVLCWTENGSGRGGTGQALRVANYYNIPIIDFGK